MVLNGCNSHSQREQLERDLYIRDGQLRCRHCQTNLGDSSIRQTLDDGEAHLSTIHDLKID